MGIFNCFLQILHIVHVNIKDLSAFCAYYVIMVGAQEVIAVGTSWDFPFAYLTQFRQSLQITVYRPSADGRVIFGNGIINLICACMLPHLLNCF